MAPLINPYKLTPQANKEHFENVRLPFFMASTSPVNNPVFVLIGGQSGAGKSGLASIVETSLQNNAITLDADLFRPSHPHYGAMLRDNPSKVFELARDDVNSWLKHAGDFARAARRNVVMDGTLRDRDHIAKVAEEYKNAGYRVELNVMATHERFSHTSIFKRFEDGLASETKAGRYVAPDFHKAAYEAIPITLQYLEEGKLVDTVRIWNRNYEVLYENNLVNGEWEKQPEAAASLEAERDREPDEEELCSLQETRSRIISMMRARGASSVEMEAIQEEFKKYPIPHSIQGVAP